MLSRSMRICGTAPLFNTPGQLVLTTLMFLGCIGPSTSTTAFMQRQYHRSRYPVDRSIFIG
ncbi:hypothetical protein [Deinococcus deserti]|uniref:hypothetical protein n=1 Tax=Deinococcus deserti TaxID=310783 RepID=UPI0013923D86|nr:hypothetical protein [Deinococcus deserti]